MRAAAGRCSAPMLGLDAQEFGVALIGSVGQRPARHPGMHRRRLRKRGPGPACVDKQRPASRAALTPFRRHFDRYSLRAGNAFDRSTGAQMLSATETVATVVQRWLAQFERAIAKSDDALLRALFRPDSHWRDVL